jgi:hypothetical protein
MDEGKSIFRRTRAGIALLTSLVALVFSGYSLYETVIRQAELRIYQPPLIYMYREGFRDVFAIPITLSNDGAQRGTVLSFDLEVTHLETHKKMRFQNLHFGESPKSNTRLFMPVTVAGRSSFTDVVLFHALSTGSFVETTGGVRLPLRFMLQMNMDATSGWFASKQPAAVVFDMTAEYVQSQNQMEAGQPTRLHDLHWTEELPSATK